MYNIYFNMIINNNIFIVLYFYFIIYNFYIDEIV